MKRITQPVSILLALTLLITTGQGCLGGGGDSPKIDEPEPVTLEFWSVFDNEDAYEEIIDSYKVLHPEVTINYRKLRYDEYEDELVRAYAEGRGPDIFSLHNTWMNGYKDLMEPMPSSVSITEQQLEGSIQKKQITVAVEKPTMSMRDLKQRYVEQVERDVVLEYRPNEDAQAVDKIYGLPFAMDSLALFYNKDLFNAAGIPNPPTSWSELDFHEKVMALTSYDIQGEVEQSAVAMGTARNVERSPDILSLLMMQVGAQFTDERGRIVFEGEEFVNALQYYTDFADPTKEVYTWNENFPGSFDAFANGETAMFIGYSYHTPLLRTTAPKLNFAIAPIPQITDARQINYANYWVQTVAKSSDHSDWAWDFLIYASEEQQVAKYLEEAKRPAVHRSLIASQQDDEDLAAFAQQTLTAESWYHGKDIHAAEEALMDLIDDYLAGNYEDPEELIEIAGRKIQQTLN